MSKAACATSSAAGGRRCLRCEGISRRLAGSLPRCGSRSRSTAAPRGRSRTRSRGAGSTSRPRSRRSSPRRASARASTRRRSASSSARGTCSRTRRCSRAIHRLAGGEVLTAEPGRVGVEAYWRYRVGERGDGTAPAELEEELAALVRSAVERDLGDADRAVVFLSGGVDSRAIAGAAARRRPAPGLAAAHRDLGRARRARGLRPRRRAPRRRDARDAPPGRGPPGQRLGPAAHRGHLSPRRAHRRLRLPPARARRDARPRGQRRAHGAPRRRVLRLGRLT